MHEICLIGATGRPDREKAIVSVVETMFDGVRREHSASRKNSIALIDEVFGAEALSARGHICAAVAPGLEAWGNESSKFDAVA